ncbi:MAG: hypothetical protein M1816_007820 [Peltula sp. TS41687]|nr:MAG: hypothetical protein M1816_007820 [Peltula sp. TS41687]
MADELRTALERVRIASQSIPDQTDWIDNVLDQNRPRKRPRPSREEIKSDLERTFLAPSTSFSTEWLNRLQQRWDAPPDYKNVFALAPTQSRTVIRFTRQGLEGRIVGYEEVTVPAGSATAKNSTSLLRKPANRADFVRGSAGYLPFTPGGLEGVEEAAAVEDALIKAQNERLKLGSRSRLDRVIDVGREGGLLEVAPGLDRGLGLASKQNGLKKDTEAEVAKTLMERQDGELTDGTPISDKPVVHVSKKNPSEDPDSAPQGDEEIDLILPVEYPALEPRSRLAVSAAKRHGKEWAHVVDVNRTMTDFRELVPNMAREWPFELDTFQKEAVYHLENRDSVFVAAHTSAGKTVVAEYAIALAAKHMTKAIYTSPIKALSNQKFRDFKNTFEDVGILTGDVQINPEASCLIMTTEILRSMLYRGADLIRDVEFVIFDEVHYVNDLERGVVWEEVIIMLPEHVTLILLSATVPNTYEFASWVGRTKKKDIYVISTPKRPVPLEHYLWANKDMYKIVDADKKFIEKGWKEADMIISGKDKIKQAQIATSNSTIQRGRGIQRGEGRGQSQQRGRGQPQRGGGHVGSAVRGKPGGIRTTAAQDRNLWVHLVQHLRKKDLLPACIFVFSKRRCEENADALSNLDYCTATEKSAIHMIFQRSMARLKPEDRTLPQIRRVKELLSRGIAVHHGGLLPIVKEVVEILFARTLVKVLFATETFAMGLNLPTRTVVFSGYRKHDGRSFRDLLPGEYTQMAGRAGRRGLDSVGYVIIVAPGSDEAPPASTLRNMILGDPTKLRSQFRLTYNMILNLLRVEALKIEEMIKRSFSENATQALLPEHEQRVRISEADLAKIKREPCGICDTDLEMCHEASKNHMRLTADLHLRLLASPIGKRMFSPKRLIVCKKDGIRKPAILLREGVSNAPSPLLHVLEFLPEKSKREPSDLLPYLPAFRRFFGKLPQGGVNFVSSSIPLSDVECVTKTSLKIDLTGILGHQPEAIQAGKEDILRLCSSWEDPAWDELDWMRVKDLQVRDLFEARKKEAEVAQNRICVSCDKFLRHFSMRHDEWLIKENILQIRQLMSDQNLQLLPDYEQRIAVLKDLDFIDENSRVQLKGKVACEIHSADELVLTELILENALADFEPEEIVALLSAFVFQEKTEHSPTLTTNLERVPRFPYFPLFLDLLLMLTASSNHTQGRDAIISLSEKVNAFQTQHQVILSSDDSNDFVSKPRFGLVEVVYEWARGMSFNLITDLTDVLEGTIVRVMTRLEETCREVKNAARIIGDPALFVKMQRAQELIKRDITAVASLPAYLSREYSVYCLAHTRFSIFGRDIKGGEDVKSAYTVEAYKDP